jgi:methyl-accepting chemotaxis protein
MKFSQKIIAAASFILLLSLGLLSTYQYFQVKAEVNNLVNSSSDELITSLRNNITAIMNSKADLTSYAASQVGDDLSPENIMNILNQKTIKKHFSIAGIGIESTGQIFFNDPGWAPPAGYDPRTRSWYKDAKQANELIFTAPYSDAESGEVLISAATPLKVNGQFAGVLFTDISLQKLADISNNTDFFWRWLCLYCW